MSRAELGPTETQHRRLTQRQEDRLEETKRRTDAVHNDVSGTVTGNLLQLGRVDNLHVHHHAVSTAQAASDSTGQSGVPGMRDWWTAEPRTETLESNLLEVLSTPPLIFHYRSKCRKPHEVFGRQRESGVEVRYDWILADGEIYSFSNPDEVPGLRAVCDGSQDILDTDSWSQCDDDDTERRYVALLNKTLRQMTLSDLEWHRKPDYLYFKASKNRKQRRLPTGAGTSRTVFMPKGKYCWHAAMNSRFIRAEGKWHLAIVPTYHFTRDGIHESKFSSSQLSGIKKRERDYSVLGFTRMWAQFLRAEPTGALFEGRDQPIEFGSLLTFNIDRGIDDEAWARLAPDSATKNDEPNLFGEL